MTWLVGSTLSNRYEIVKKIGEGGMAIVYLGRDLILGRSVAIKVLRSQFAADADFVERFGREAQAAASLSHPNVVNIFDVGAEDDVHYIVMEHVEGRNLKEMLRSEGPLPVKTAVVIAKEICRALEAAHRQGLIHRDIKPHNILVTKDCQVKVTDFGIARAASAATLTQTGTVIGSVHYLSPEQATGRQVGVFSDVYSVGVLLYEMVTGKVPFDGESPVAVALKHLQDEPRSPRIAVPEVPEALENVIFRAMAKDPALRYPSIRDMLQDLRTVLGGEPLATEEDQLEEMRSVQVENEPIAAPTPNNERALAVPPDVPSAATTEETIIHVPKKRVQASVTPPAEAKSTEEVDSVSKRKSNQRPRKGSRALRFWLWVLVLFSFASGMVWAGASLFDSLFPGEVAVPDIVGMNVDEAKTVLRGSDLDLRITHEVNSDQPVNTIVRQTPVAQRNVRKGRTIDVHISVGKEIVEVPDLGSLSEREAPLRLVQNGLVLGSIEYLYQPDMPPNLVVGQEPGAGDRVQRGSSVNLVLSTGAAPVAMVDVPSFISMPLESAISRIEELGLVLGDTFPEVDPAFQPGQVTDQAPGPGSEVEVGSVVNLVYYPASDEQEGTPPPVPAEPLPADPTLEGEMWVQALITINVPPGPERLVEIVIIDNISARRVYREAHRGDARVPYVIRGRGHDAMYQVYIGGELAGQGLIREAR